MPWERDEVRAAVAEVFLVTVAYVVVMVIELVKKRDLMSRTNISTSHTQSEATGAPKSEAYKDGGEPVQQQPGTSATKSSEVQEFSQFDDLSVYLMFHVVALLIAIYRENGIITVVFAWLHFIFFGVYAALIVSLSFTLRNFFKTS